MVARSTGSYDVNAALLRGYAASARANEFLVERLDPTLWRARPPAAKMRSIAATVAHMHNCGLVYLTRANPRAKVPAELDRFRVTPNQAVRALAAKRQAVLTVLAPLLTRGGRVGGCEHDPVRFLMYYMAHDAHHRGQILQFARLLGKPVSVETMSGLWQWNIRARESEPIGGP